MPFKTMHYNLQIKPLYCSSSLLIQNIGRIHTSIWSIRPHWRPYTQTLEAVEVLRDNEFRKVDIELNLRSCTASSGNEDYYEYGEPFENNNDLSRRNKTFKGTLFQDERGHTITTKLSLERGCHFRGCIIVIYGSSVNKSVVSTTSPSSPSKLSGDLLRLLDNPNSYPDATLKCGTVEIPVHKCILSVRSPILAAMFSNKRATLKRRRSSAPLKEDFSSTVHITNIKPDVLQATLRYIYGGKTDTLTDVLAADLLFAADMYQLDELKSLCVAKLKSNVAVANIFRILVLGELHDKSLKTHAIDFLCRCDCFSQLEEREDWKTLEKEYPSLALEVVKSIVKFVQQPK